MLLFTPLAISPGFRVWWGNAPAVLATGDPPRAGRANHAIFNRTEQADTSAA
jgi:hypothetical protein